MWVFRAVIRMAGSHDFTTDVRADDQIQARNILEGMYGRGCVVGGNVWRV